MAILYHQKDKYGNECWMLDGITKALGKPLVKSGWTWLKGRPGIWHTTDSKVAQPVIDSGIKVISRNQSLPKMEGKP